MCCLMWYKNYCILAKACFISHKQPTSLFKVLVFLTTNKFPQGWKQCNALPQTVCEWIASTEEGKGQHTGLTIIKNYSSFLADSLENISDGATFFQGDAPTRWSNLKFKHNSWMASLGYDKIKWMKAFPSKQTVVLFWWRSETRKFGIKQVDRGKFPMCKTIRKSWDLKALPFIRAKD